MVKFYNERIDFEKDPLAQAKYINIQSLRYVSDEIRTLKENMYSKIYFSFSLIFAIFIVIFAQTLNWLMVSVFIDLSLIILVLSAKTFYDQRKERVQASRAIIKKLNELGMKIEE
ncbi:MAG TPA: hypothetical protein VJ438_03655 [Candidatus Nanoarchaeia archaeon]|nr:hypothetical protein [Candidatus Nanoarchaeia archaeon]